MTDYRVSRQGRDMHNTVQAPQGQCRDSNMTDYRASRQGRDMHNTVQAPQGAVP